MNSLLLNATDTLFFRDGRPFNMGEDTYAQGIFPPPPSVVYGALRTAYIAHHLEEGSLKELINDSEKLRIQSIFLSDGAGKIYVPAPRDLYVRKGADEGAFPVLKTKPLASSLPTPKMLRYATNEKPDVNTRLIALASLEQYLKKERGIDAIATIPLNDFLEREVKIGIRRNNRTHTTDEGLLYRMEMLRPAKQQNGSSEIATLQFLVNYSGITIPTETWLRMGGDRKPLYIDTFEKSKTIPCPTLRSTQFKIYLATPAVFEDGWHPQRLFSKYNLKLLAAATGKPTPLGGFDMKAKRPKPMLRAVAAGAVYYVEANSLEEAQKTANAIHRHTVSDYNLAQQGFGTAFVGNI
ncbi:MAG: type III-B CRISPR module-associated protein Cmr3 [Bacteroidota bacterium]